MEIDYTNLRNPIESDSFYEILNSVLDGLIIILSPIIVLSFVIVGVMFVFGHGNPQKLAAAKAALVWTIIGAFLILASHGILALVRGTLEEFTTVAQANVIRV